VKESDQVWYQDKTYPASQRKEACYVASFIGKHDDDYAYSLFESLEPRTCEQNTADWFTDRQLSVTVKYNLKPVETVAQIWKEDETDQEVVDAFAVSLSMRVSTLADWKRVAMEHRCGSRCHCSSSSGK
jgi:hypothetical protein